MERQELDELTREQLIALAIQLGISKPRSLTMPELIDEILSRTVRSSEDRARSRGFLGRARDLLAGVVERGLHLPEMTRALRRPEPASKTWPKAPPPLATVTLAELYAGQGHFEKALTVLDEILTREPEHSEAHALRTQIAAKLDSSGEPAAEEASMASEAETNADEPIAETTEPVAQAESDKPAEQVAQGEAQTEPVAQPEPSEAASEETADTTSETAALDSAAEAAPEALPENAENAEDAEEANSAGIWPAPSADAMTELPLPERYNVDEIVAIAVDPTTLYLYWEVRPTTFARARAMRSEGSLVVRTVHVTPSWDGPITEQRDLQTDALYGDAYVRDLRPGSNIRVAVGWLAHGIFEPFAIGAEVATARTEPAASTAKKLGRWSADALGAAQAGADATTPWAAPPHAAVLEAFLGGPAMTGASKGARGRIADRLGAQPARFDVQGDDEKRAVAKPEGQTRGGSSEIPRGGASALVRPGTR